MNDGSNEFAPFLNIMNEWYVRDTSRKIKSVLHNKGMDGKHLTSNAIYGYKKAPDDPDLWIIDEEAATVVRRIYQLIMEGNGPMQVARILKDEKVERPSYYLAKQGLGTCRGSCDMSRPYTWTASTISDIVKKPEYIMIHEFVDKIVVHEADKSTGDRIQQIDIYLKYVGKLDVPMPELTPEKLKEEDRKRRKRAWNRTYMRRKYEREKAEREAKEKGLSEAVG